MGKKRSEIKVIDSKKSRKDTFHKRKFGLLKKASELSMLCNLKLLLFFEDLTGKVIQYSSHENYDPVDYFELNKRRRTIIRFNASDYPDFFHKPSGDRTQVKKEEMDDEYEDYLGLDGKNLQETTKSDDLDPSLKLRELNQLCSGKVNCESTEKAPQLTRELESISSKLQTLLSNLKVQNGSSHANELEGITNQITGLLTKMNKNTPLESDFGGLMTIERSQSTNLSKFVSSPYEKPQKPQGTPRKPFEIIRKKAKGKISEGQKITVESPHVYGNENYMNINVNYYNIASGSFAQPANRPLNERVDQVSRQSSNLSNFASQLKNDQPSRQSSGGLSIGSKDDCNRPVLNEKIMKGTRDYWSKYGRIDSGISDMMKQEGADSIGDFFHPHKVDERLIPDDVLGKELLKKDGKFADNDAYSELRSFEQLQIEDQGPFHHELEHLDKMNTSLERREQSMRLFSPLPLSSLSLGQQKAQFEGDWYSQYYQTMSNQTGNLNASFSVFNPIVGLNTSNLSDNSIMKSPRVTKKVREWYS